MTTGGGIFERYERLEAENDRLKQQLAEQPVSYTRVHTSMPDIFAVADGGKFALAINGQRIYLVSLSVPLDISQGTGITDESPDYVHLDRAECRRLEAENRRLRGALRKAHTFIRAAVVINEAIAGIDAALDNAGKG